MQFIMICLVLIVVYIYMNQKFISEIVGEVNFEEVENEILDEFIKLVAYYGLFSFLFGTIINLMLYAGLRELM